MPFSLYAFIVSDNSSESVVDIGVRLADGSFFPIFGEKFRGSKKLLITTVRDNQENVQIDLFKGMEKEVFEDAYIGSLIIENLPPSAKGEPEIELVVGIDSEGNLQAEATEAKSGERQTLSVSLETLAGRAEYEMPEFDMEAGAPMTVAQNDSGAETIAGETYPVGAEDRRKTYLHHKKSGPGKVILIIVLIILLLGGVAVGVYYLIPWFQTLFAGQSVDTTMQSPAPSPGTTAIVTSSSSSSESSTEASSSNSSVSSAEVSSSSSQSSTQKSEGTWYIVVKGDTLWDLSRQYYRDPFQYMKIFNAPENNIKDPDLILEKQRIFIPNN